MATNTNSIIQPKTELFGSRKGRWTFLFTELALFGGMFLVYAIYRFNHQQEFHAAAKELKVIMGSLNAVILITISLTISLSIVAIKKGKRTLSVFLQLITILMAIGFLANKFYEWSIYLQNGLFPGMSVLQGTSSGENIYFLLYYIVTGLHGVQVIAGTVIMLVLARLTWHDTINSDSFSKLESAGLYWQIVTIIWIFLFPLFYLIS
jgi:cytochrome c oxidase subunit III